MAILTVGDGDEFQTISAAVDAAASGDTIDVAAGTYTNDFLTLSQDVTLQAVGGTVYMTATEDPPDGKAIIDEGGAGVSVSITGFDVSGAVVPDGNGAAIRYEGGSLTLDDVDFHNNQEGLLGAADPNGTITITNSTFVDNGTGTGYTHDLYIGDIAAFSISGSTIEAANVGHEIKSRAAENTISDNVIMDGPTGDSSYEIDLPNGGDDIITGNVIEKGPNAQNPIAISVGEEGNLYPNSSLTVTGNAIIDDLGGYDDTAVVNDTGTTATISGNTLWGWTTIVSGPATLGDNVTPGSEPAMATLSPGAETFSSACFASGTRIATAKGECPVEALAVGDILPARASGPAAIRWIGHRQLDCRRHPRPWDVWPVRVARDAFGPARPRRDLLLSPDHAVAWAGVLIPIRYLINGATIRQEPREHITYWHVELESHDVIEAEGLPVESYLDTGNRGSFANGGAPLQLHPGFARAVWSDRACARLVTEGREPIAARRHLLRRATELGHAITAEPDLRLCVDGRIIHPTGHGMALDYRLPPLAHRIRLLSRSVIPAWHEPDHADHRRLGVAVGAIEADGAVLALADPRLGAGWHDPEAGGQWRWTDGAASLPVAGAQHLRLTLAMTQRYWQDPPRNAAVPAASTPPSRASATP